MLNPSLWTMRTEDIKNQYFMIIITVLFIATCFAFGIIVWSWTIEKDDPRMN